MIRSLALCLLVLLAAVPVGPAAAADMTFLISNKAGKPVAVELYGRDGRSWPGDDQVYMLPEDERKSISIECEAGEPICYGAWLVGNDTVTWGAGPDNDENCGDCCAVCVATSLIEIDLSR